MPCVPYSSDSIMRALMVHAEAGRIRGWRLDEHNRFVVSLNRAEDLTLRTLREAYVFVAGLASAHLNPNGAEESA